MKGDKFEWAFVPKFRPEVESRLTRVWVLNIISPSEIFVQRDEFIEQLDDLDKELDAHVNSAIQEKYPNYRTLFASYYEVGMVVAVEEQVNYRYQTNRYIPIDKYASLTLNLNSSIYVRYRSTFRWNRGLIVKIFIEEEGNEETLFDVFSVDYGEVIFGLTTKSLYPIPQKFVAILPFQAIALNLDHLIPVGEDWEGMREFSRRDTVWKSTGDAKKYLEDFLIPDNDAKIIEVAVS